MVPKYITYFSLQQVGSYAYSWYHNLPIVALSPAYAPGRLDASTSSRY